MFGTVEEVRRVTEKSIEDYNRERPHDSLGGLPPQTFLPRPMFTREASKQLSR